jgi:hyaluronan synthase
LRRLRWANIDMDTESIARKAPYTIPCFENPSPLSVAPSALSLGKKGLGALFDWILYGAILAGLAGAIYFSVAGKIFHPLFKAGQEAQWATLILKPSILWAFMGTLFLIFRTFLWIFYRPFPPASQDTAPSLSVIIPAYNEGAMVQKAVYSVLATQYPQEKLEIFVIDDGSQDDTWVYIKKAFIDNPSLITAVRFPTNKGKRAALEEGFRRARGEILVTIDSDSVIESRTLLEIAGPFRDPRIGAVAGRVAVFNREQGILPKMLKVRYLFSFDVLRAVQSKYRTVYCCPGALSAYRASVVRQILQPWMNQTFLGVTCTYGEDRSMTNFILGRGFDTVYQRSAQVFTVVPWTYKRLWKMYLRWDRSYIRETLHLFRIVWRRPPGIRFITLFDLFITNLRFPIGYVNLALLAFLSIQSPMTILRLFCVIGLFSLMNMLYYLKNERSWDFLYGILYSYFSFLSLFWVFPYALLTLRSRSWMTR